MSDLWVEASIDTDAEQWAYRMAHAKVAVASLWPFLASAATEDEFEHRLALSFDRLATRIEPPLIEPVVSSLREDFRTLSIPVPDVVPMRWATASKSARAIEVEPGEVGHLATGRDSMQFFHVASQQWISLDAAAAPGPGNPHYFDGGPEQGPLTDETGGYPPETGGPDPWNPMNGNLPLPPGTARPPAESFPAQPQPWTVTPGTEWREEPMQFNSARGSSTDGLLLYQAADSLAYTDEGVQTGTGQNPYFFGQGTEGLGSQQNGFPPDVSLPEPDERVDMYQNMSPFTAAYHFADYHYVHEESPGDWVITQKGTGKVLSHHDSEEKAHEAFRAMMWSKHGSLQFFDPTRRHTADMGNYTSDSYTDANPYSPSSTDTTQDSGVQPPSSMMPGGVGAEALPPMSNAMNSSTPTSMSRPATPADPSGSDMAAKTGMRRMAEEYRERPTIFNPTGAGDDYTARTWENSLTQSPRQDAEARGANTPQRPASPIPQNSSSNMVGGREDDEEDDGDNRRESVRRYIHAIAAQAASRAVKAYA